MKKDLFYIDANALLKKKFVDEVMKLYKTVSNGYYPDITFLINESSLLSLLDDSPDLDNSLKYIINYYLTHRWMN